MIDMKLQIVAALTLDLLFGDPRWLPHPVKLMGNFAMRLEPVARKVFPSERIAGIAAAIIVISVSGVSVWAIIAIANLIDPIAGSVVSILVIYTSIAARDLVTHSNAVYKALAENDLAKARKKLSMIVGRDTEELTEAQITRAAIESVAENTVDGVTAPLFFAAIAGPIGVIVYKAINTLDSTFGYKNQRYINFGWASARIDDAANYVPARLTGPVMCVAAAVTRLDAVRALKIMQRDSLKHASPNAGFTEAAVAGALRIQLGGVGYYAGQPFEKPLLGDAVNEPDKNCIKKANALMLVTTVMFAAIMLAVNHAAVLLFQSWRGSL